MPFASSRPEPHGPLPDDRVGAAYCGVCGDGIGSGDHPACERRRALEPPRFCGHCGRRMKVQVIPGAWTATCVEHGTVEHATWS